MHLSPATTWSLVLGWIVLSVVVGVLVGKFIRFGGPLMTSHTLHEDSHTHGLADDCPRCREHAEHPEASLDRTNTARLLRGQVYTALDRAAASRLTRAIATARYLTGILDGESS